MKKNIVLISKQIYEDNVQESKVESQAEIIQDDKKIEIIFEQEIANQKIPYKILIKQEKVAYKRAENIMIFEKNKQTEATYKTPYGNLNLKLFLQELNVGYLGKDVACVELKYTIEIKNMKKYDNYIKIEIN